VAGKVQHFNVRKLLCVYLALMLDVHNATKVIATSFQSLIKPHNIETYGEVEVQLHAYA